jgi:hypothetical protein
LKTIHYINKQLNPDIAYFLFFDIIPRISSLLIIRCFSPLIRP